jgi:hypothetical protein
MKLLQCNVMIRLFFMLQALVVGSSAAWGRGTLAYQIAHFNASGMAAALLMMVCGVLGLVDLVVNDLMPDRFVIKYALRDRHLVNMVLSLCYCMLMFVAARYSFPIALLPYYGLSAVFIPLAAFADVHKRFNKKKGHL